jgi:hypothetical protein
MYRFAEISMRILYKGISTVSLAYIHLTKFTTLVNGKEIESLSPSRITILGANVSGLL